MTCQKEGSIFQVGNMVWNSHLRTISHLIFLTYLDSYFIFSFKRVRKVPGFSWIEVKNTVHTFSVGDSVHPEKDKICAFLEELDLKMKKLGYVSATKMVLHEVEEEEKEHMLKYHSEKLAVAFGILNVPPGRPIRVIKKISEYVKTATMLLSTSLR